jgi:hypothetical protein
MIKTQRRADALEDEATLSRLEAHGMSHDIFLDVYRHRYTVHVKSTTSIHRSNCACNGARSALGEHAAACRRLSDEEFAMFRRSAPSGAMKGGRRSGPWAFEWSKLGLRDAKAADQRCYVRRFLEEKEVSSIVEIAAAVNASSYLLARMLIEQICNVKKGSRVKALVKDPARIAEECARNGVASGAAQRLRAALQLSAEVDPHYSPHIDRLKRHAGDEYEYLLQEKLRIRGIAFESEESLRIQGQPKTPDVVLLHPMGVVSDAGVACIVNWIDSKAMFGDPDTHRQNEAQFESYCNRFGSGLVVYWGGYVGGLADETPQVIVMADLPRRWLVAGRTSASTLATC